jgi:hypothetical protein
MSYRESWVILERKVDLALLPPITREMVLQLRSGASLLISCKKGLTDILNSYLADCHTLHIISSMRFVSRQRTPICLNVASLDTVSDRDGVVPSLAILRGADHVV